MRLSRLRKEQSNQVFLGISVMIGLLLFAAAVMDLKRKSISRGLIFALMMVCLAGIFVREEFGIWNAVSGAAIGFCAIGLSMVSREQIGRGDGLVIAALGLVTGFRECLAVVCLASVLMALASAAVLLLKKGNRNTRLPFIPALFVGYVTCMLI